YPALVTEVRHPNGFVEQAVYDARGNRVEQTAVDPYGDGRNATTRYQYADTLWPDFVTRITGPEGVASTAVPDDDIFEFGYDPLTGNRLWQQDARGDSSRVAFRYDALGLLRAVDAPLTPPDSVEYDARGNLRRTRTPSGFVTEYLKDALGR
ncbi:MAG: hypothetical protein GWO04_46630, partial [Actinobacteria bacterium]|nr:hypothetical protein [Actinomycetota bacterium]